VLAVNNIAKFPIHLDFAVQNTSAFSDQTLFIGGGGIPQVQKRDSPAPSWPAILRFAHRG
jgi:hypothetical protein